MSINTINSSNKKINNPSSDYDSVIDDDSGYESNDTSATDDGSFNEKTNNFSSGYDSLIDDDSGYETDDESKTEDNSSSDYNSSSIKVLKGLEGVRKRPGMYIGDTEDAEKGLTHMVLEVVHNGVDESLAGYCSKITVVLHKDGSASVQDDGRGIPVDIHAEEGRSAAEVIMTVLHAGGKFDNNVYKVSGGLHGVGVSVVNALSKKLHLVIYRDGKHYEQIYAYGKPLAPLAVVGQSQKRGTWIRFYPDLTIFTGRNSFPYDYLLEKLRKLCFLNAGITIEITDEREEGKSALLQYKEGLKDFVGHLIKNKPCILKKCLHASGMQNGVSVEVALIWQESFSKENILCFTNTIPQEDGGTHLIGFKTALTRVLNQYLEKEGFTKKFKVQMIGEDFREGLVAVLSVKVPDPKFSSQTKEKLVSSEVRSVVETVVSKHIEDFLLENPNDAQAIALKAIKAGQAREAAAKARQASRKDPLKNISDLPGKLHDCQEKDPRFSELFLVEGKSAGGTVKQARSRRFQAVLPLRGKILNIERISFDKMLSSEEVATLIAALGCGIGPEYNLEKLRYHRIIIMTDADVDGSHIRTLLLTFFYRQFPELIDEGYLYIAHPPLYKLKKGKQEVYLQDDMHLEAWLAEHVLADAVLYEKNTTTSILSNQALGELMAEYRDIKAQLKMWEREYPMDCLHALLELPILTLEHLSNLEYMQQFCKQWQAILDKRIKQADIYYQISYYTQTIDSSTQIELEDPLYLPQINEIRYNVETRYYFESTFFHADDYKKITERVKHVEKCIPSEAVIKQSGREKIISSFYELYEWLMQEAARGYTVQRYKGLGEMDWEELLPVVNPQTRQLSRVTMTDAREADRMITILMGHIVEDRRKFIEQNALDVTDIDI